MTPAEMAEHCREQIALLGDDAVVVFRMRGRWGRSSTKRLFGRHGGPVGRIVAEERDTVVVMFKAATVLKALENAQAGEKGGDEWR